MTPVLVGMAVCVIAALAVLALVAVPRVRGGDKLLTPDGEESVRDATRRAKARAAQAVERSGRTAQDVRGRAAGVGAGVVGKAQAARSRRTEHQAARPRRTEHTAQPATDAPTEPAAERMAADEVELPDPWTPAPDVRPAGSSARTPSGGGSTGARTATLATAPPSLTGAPGDAALAERVIDLRDPVPDDEPDDERAAPATSPEQEPKAQVQPGPLRPRHRPRRDAELGWGEPRPGPRHGR